MTIPIQVPSRNKCRYLWTLGDYNSIVKNYESNNLYRHLFIKGIRKLDLESIYLTALLHLRREDDIEKAKKSIIDLKTSGLLPYRLELNKFAIENLHIKPTNEMSMAYDAINQLSKTQEIKNFWEEHCSNKRIAIVGNGIIDTKEGKHIDNSDYVIRFNKFKTSGFEDFVGRKTSAWCRICDIRPERESLDIYNSIKTNILTDNPLNTAVGPKFLEDILKEDNTFYYIPQDLVVKLSNKLGAIPSSGARLLISLSKYRKNLNITAKVFGFSFQSKNYNKNRFDHYFENKPESKERAHNIKNEVDLLKLYFPAES